jgi:tetratricopeptide (TPR) repeat protein
MHFYRRELKEAVRCYEAAIGIAPDDIISRYQYIVGTQKERQGDVVEAFKRYQNAIEAEPTFVDPYVELGGLLVKIEDFEGAAQCYRDAVRLDPADVANHFNLKAVLTRLAQRDPERYRDELARAETAYGQATKEHGMPKEISKHQW